MTEPLLGCIADDYTGATDLCSMLVRAGLRVVLCFDVPDETNALADFDAIVIALKSRSIAPEAAVERSLAALRFLQGLNTQRFFFKYCSTFDSTPRGNIGPVADALADALAVDQVVFCPAFPENGRTVYQGWLFVGSVPLHESSMKDHPLNPMHDSDLVRVLQAQSQRAVHRLGLQTSKLGSEPGHYIADAIDEDDLQCIAEVAANHRLLTGGSAIARHWGEILSADRMPSRDATEIVEQKASNVRCVVLAGSCSASTRKQIADFAGSYPIYRLDPADGRSLDEAVQAAFDWCLGEWDRLGSNYVPLLIASGDDPARVAAARQAFGEQAAADRTESIFAGIAEALVQRGVRRLIVAGGETSGAVTNALRVQSVRIGREIAPGVPWVTSLQSPNLQLVLKSGNFGGPRFFSEALEAIA